MEMDVPTHEHMVKPSQGVHLVLDRSFLQSDYAIMIPETDDGRHSDTEGRNTLLASPFSPFKNRNGHFNINSVVWV